MKLGLLYFLMTSEFICHNFSKKKKDEVNNSFEKLALPRFNGS